MFDAIVVWLGETYGLRLLLTGWGAIVLQYAILALIERMAPAERGQTLRSIGTNLRITAIFLLLTPVANFLPGLAANRVVEYFGGGLLAIDLPAFVGRQPEAVGWALKLLCAFIPLFAFDFFYYWFHRLQHRNPWLWRVHRLHHTDQAVNVTTSLRHHWLEEPLRSLLILIPMNLLFKMTPVESGVLGVFLGVWGYVIHMNFRLYLGPLATVLVGPQGHRIHHSLEPQHLDKNFAAFFPVWDILFGTFHRSRRGEYPRTGVANTPSDMTLRAALFGPFLALRNT